MLRNYLKIAWRNITRHKNVSFINIAGLAIGMACCLVIMLFVRDELSYDQHNKDADRIYRVVKDFVNDDGSRLPDATTPPAVAYAMQKELPEIEASTRIMPGWGSKYLLSYNNKKFFEENYYRVDSSIFNVFTFTFLQGEAKTALNRLNNIVITKSVAEKYFGKEDPMGKVLKLNNQRDFTITGVIKNMPENAHFHADFLARAFVDSNLNNNWGWYNFYTYVKLKKNTSLASVTPKIQTLYKKNNAQGRSIFYTQALKDIHLGSNLKWEIEPNSERLYIYVFSLIAAFVIIIACINYINLSTARASLRAKEIGVRKVTGAISSSLIKQFLVESVLTVLFAFLMALVLATVLLPVINQVTQKSLALFSVANIGLLGISIITAMLIGVIAGLYPAIYLSSFKPVLVLKGTLFAERNTFSLRKMLVVLQFTISVVLLAGMLVVFRQIHFLQKAKLGFNKEQILLVDGVWSMPRATYEGFKHDILQIPGVVKAAAADGVLGGQNWTTSYSLKGSDNNQLVNFLSVGQDFIDVMGLQIKEGRGFSAQFPADTINYNQPGVIDRLTGSVILNEKAVKDLGIPSPVVGQRLVQGTDNDTTYYVQIIGVVKDFHFASLRSEIKPFAFIRNPQRDGLYTIKLSTSDLRNTVAAIEKKWNAAAPERPFQYSFLDDTFTRLYKAEDRFNKIFTYLTVLAIIIACLGLFGLSAFMTERRTKEIGIRKVVGASVTGIVTLLSKDFIKLVLIAIVIGSPIAWYAMNKWLQDFAYRTNIEWWIFLLAGAMAVAIALITVSFQAIKAAIANPVKSLKTE